MICMSGASILQNFSQYPPLSNKDTWKRTSCIWEGHSPVWHSLIPVKSKCTVFHTRNSAGQKDFCDLWLKSPRSPWVCASALASVIVLLNQWYLWWGTLRFSVIQPTTCRVRLCALSRIARNTLVCSNSLLCSVLNRKGGFVNSPANTRETFSQPGYLCGHQKLFVMCQKYPNRLTNSTTSFVNTHTTRWDAASCRVARVSGSGSQDHRQPRSQRRYSIQSIEQPLSLPSNKNIGLSCRWRKQADNFWKGKMLGYYDGSSSYSEAMMTTTA